MTAHLIIAPGTQGDGRWTDLPERSAIRFIRRAVPPTWLAADLDTFITDDLDIGTAILRTFVHPAWRVPLKFWVDAFLGAEPVLPDGYILPGLVCGPDPLPQTRICWLCRDQGVIRALEVQEHPATLCIGHIVEARINRYAAERTLPW